MTAAFAVIALLMHSVASAQVGEEPRPPVHLSVEDCADVSVDGVRAILAAELGALLVEDGDPQNTTLAIVACAESIATLQVVDPITGKTLTRRIALRELHQVARTRFVALAMAELVAASWIELEATPVIEPLDRTASEETRASALETVRERSAPTRELRLSLLGVFSVLGEPLRGSVGGGVRLDHEPNDTLGWSASISGEHGQIDTEIGNVSIDQFVIQLEATLRAEVGPAMVQVALGARGGGVVLSGNALGRADVTAESFVRPTLGPHAALRLWLEPIPAFLLFAGAEFSWIALGAFGLVDERRRVDVWGPELVVELGIGTRI